MKKIIIFLCTIFFGFLSIKALDNSFIINTSNFSTSSIKKNNILNSLNKNYRLNYSLENNNNELRNQIIDLSIKTTKLLLRSTKNTHESPENYYKRHKEYLSLRYNPQIPRDANSFSGYKEDSQEFKDDILSGISVPSMYLELNKIDAQYSSIGNIRVSIGKDVVISYVVLPNVTIKEEDNQEYRNVQTNLIIYYWFKKLNNDYKLYYIYAEKSDELSNYLQELESNENTTSLAIAPRYVSEVDNLYSFSKLNSLSENDIKTLYQNNYKNLVKLYSYYNNIVVEEANGFFINDGILVTSWNFIEKSLIDSQYIAINDAEGNNYKMDGIITINIENDIVVIKLKEEVKHKVMLGDYTMLEIEDPVIAISSKSSVGFTTSTGIVTSTDGFIRSLLPLNKNDQGSPLFDKNGQVIGMNNSKSLNTAFSLATNSSALQEIQEKFNNIDFKDIEVISFDKLKNDYFYITYFNEVISNNIPKKQLELFSDIGNVNEIVKLKLVKASYKNGIISLRYENKISKYISSMHYSSEFKSKLIQQNFKEIINSSKKSIYENNKFRIIISEDFDYLMIVMVRK